MTYVRKISTILTALALSTLIVLIAGPARSADSIVPLGVLESLSQETDAQKSFYKALLNARPKDALLLWHSAHEGTAFGKSGDGQALYAFMKFKSGLETQGLQTLMQLKPVDVSEPVKSLWQEAAPEKHFVWRSFRLEGRNGRAWQAVFDEPSKSRPLHPVTNARALERLRVKAVGTKDAGERDWLLWQTAVGASLLNRNDIALNSYAQLLSQSGGTVPKDHVLMAQARTLFQMNRFDEALASYELVPRSSDFWLEALEEMAWANVRLQRYDQSHASIKTLLSPVFSPQVGPEPHFMRALVAVQRCDFPMVFASFEEFKKTQQLRIQSLQKLKSKELTAEMKKNLNTIAAAGLDWKAIGPKVQTFPHLFYRDELFTRHIAELAQARQEEVAAAKLIEKAEDQELATASLKTALDESRKRATKLKEESFPKMINRLATLAEEDLANIAALLRKMHVLEAEAVQRMYLFDEENKKKIPKITRGKDTLVFPDNNEVWVDALTDYQVRSRGCPDMKGTSVSQNK